MANWLTIANLLALIGSVLINVWLFFAQRSDGRWKAMQTRMDAFDADWRSANAEAVRRVAVLETRVESLPTQDDLIEIRAQLGHIDKTTAGLEERSKHTLSSVQRIEHYLMEAKR